MTLDAQQIVRLGDELYDALRNRQTLLPLSDRASGIDI